MSNDLKHRILIDQLWSQTSKSVYRSTFASSVFFTALFTYSFIDFISGKNFLVTHFYQFGIILSTMVGLFSFIMLISTIRQLTKNFSDFHPSDSFFSFVAKAFGLFFTTFTCIFVNAILNDYHMSSKTSLIFLLLCTSFFILSEKLASKKKVIFLSFMIQNYYIILRCFARR